MSQEEVRFTATKEPLQHSQLIFLTLKMARRILSHVFELTETIRSRALF